MKQEHKALTAIIATFMLGGLTGAGIAYENKTDAVQDTTTAPVQVSLEVPDICVEALDRAQDLNSYAMSASDLGHQLVEEVNLLDPEADNTASHLYRVLEEIDAASAEYSDPATSCLASMERAQ